MTRRARLIQETSGESYWDGDVFEPLDKSTRVIGYDSTTGHKTCTQEEYEFYETKMTRVDKVTEGLDEIDLSFPEKGDKPFAIVSGFIGALRYTRYSNNTVYLSGSLARVLGLDNLYPLTPEEHGEAQTKFFEMYAIDLSTFIVSRIEITTIFMLPYKMKHVKELVGSLRGRKPVCITSGNRTTFLQWLINDDEPTIYWPFKSFELRWYRKDLELHGKGEPGMLENEGWYPHRIEKSHLKGCHRRFRALLDRPLEMSDLVMDEVFTIFVKDFVETILDVTRKNLTPRPLESINGRKNVIRHERALALDTLLDLDATVDREIVAGALNRIRRNSGARDKAMTRSIIRSKLYRLSFKHGYIDPHSFWGQVLTSLQVVSDVLVPNTWRKFRKTGVAKTKFRSICLVSLSKTTEKPLLRSVYSMKSGVIV